jgi:hypothetical protein
MIIMADAEAVARRVRLILAQKLPRPIANQIIDWGRDMRGAGCCLLDAMTIRTALEEEFNVEITDKQELAMLDMSEDGLVNFIMARTGVAQ